MKKLLLIGSGGMLGAALSHVLSLSHTVSTLERSQFDIAKGRWDKLSIAGFDYVINAAGLINRRQDDAANFYAVNSIFPHVLSALCARSGSRLIHFSTDCVFDGHQAPYFEDSPVSATDLYGKSKSLGEPNLALVIRTSIIGPETTNFYNLLCWTLSQDHINGFTNHLWNGVTTLELSILIRRIIDENLFTEGVRHIFANDYSKHDLVKMICSSFKHNARIIPTSAPAPRDTRLRTRYPDFVHSLGLQSMEHQLTDLLAVTGPDGRWINNRSAVA